VFFTPEDRKTLNLPWGAKWPALDLISVWQATVSQPTGWREHPFLFRQRELQRVIFLQVLEGKVIRDIEMGQWRVAVFGGSKGARERESKGGGWMGGWVG
jgi:hypothetical protein